MTKTTDPGPGEPHLRFVQAEIDTPDGCTHTVGVHRVRRLVCTTCGSKQCRAITVVKDRFAP